MNVARSPATSLSFTACSSSSAVMPGKASSPRSPTEGPAPARSCRPASGSVWGPRCRGIRSGSISPSPALLEPDSEELRGPSERVSCPGGRLRAWRSVGKLSGSRVLVDRVRSRGTWRPRRGQPRSIVGLQDGLWGAAPGSAGPGTELLWSESLISTAKRNCESSCVK